MEIKIDERDMVGIDLVGLEEAYRKKDILSFL
jgi:hypothetical protein